MKHLLALAVVASSLLAYSQTQNHLTGNITGTVVEQNGIPLFDATVYAVPESLSLDGISPHSVKTNRDGTFNFGEKLEWGTYKLYARKDKDAYPDPLDTFYADAKLATATADLAEANPSKEVTIMLGEKAGVITGRVVDADTGAPLKARIAFIDEDGNGHSVSSQSKTGEYYALVPAEKDVIVMVDVYSPHHRRTEVPFPHLQLESGQEVVLDIPVLKN
jgi:hypothetical protein